MNRIDIKKCTNCEFSSAVDNGGNEAIRFCLKTGYLLMEYSKCKSWELKSIYLESE